MMIKSTKNQLYNIGNPHQGDTKKVLCVCSAGLLRSATLQNFLIREYGYNVRNCGSEETYALIPISDALCLWADEIVFVKKSNYDSVKEDIKKLGVVDKVKILDIPDIYGFNEPALIDIIREQYKATVDG